MANPKITTIDGLSNNPVVREMTNDEAELLADRRSQALLEIEADEARAAARQAVLDKLGLTADEAAALLG